MTTYNIVGLEFASNARVPSPLYTIVWKRFDNCFLFSFCSLFVLFLFLCVILLFLLSLFLCLFVFLASLFIFCLSFVYLLFNLLINYNRVVLDEAHLIKNRSTQQTQAAWGLRASSKWCLTGTPIQNKVSLPLLFFILLPVFIFFCLLLLSFSSILFLPPFAPSFSLPLLFIYSQIDDLYSLLRFIQLEPFTDFNWWNRLIARPIKNKDLSGYSRLKVQKGRKEEGE